MRRRPLIGRFSVPFVNSYRLELALKMGATRAIDVKTEKIKDIVDELGMKEGFDVGLEISGKVVLSWTDEG